MKANVRFCLIYPKFELEIGLTANTPSDKQLVRKVKIEGQSPLWVSIGKSKRL